MTIAVQQLREITKTPLIAILATVNPSGSPQATPIWYDYDGEHFIVTVHSGRVKARNIRLNPKVSLVVVDTVNNGTPLIVNGAAELIEDGANEATLRMGVRYEGEAGGRKEAEGLIDYARSIGERRLIIRITPERIIYGH
jgi:PPOX class probable F420-dependent enzyme